MIVVYRFKENNVQITQKCNIEIVTLKDFDNYTDCMFELVGKIFSSYVGEFGTKENLQKIEQNIEDKISFINKDLIIHETLTKRSLDEFWRKKYKDDQQRFDELTNGNVNVYFDKDRQTLRIDPRYLKYLILKQW